MGMHMSVGAFGAWKDTQNRLSRDELTKRIGRENIRPTMECDGCGYWSDENHCPSCGLPAQAPHKKHRALESRS